MSTPYKISNLVESQVPDFVRADHPNFVAFLEAYYEYLEQDVANLEDGRAIERLKNLQNYFDIDKTLDDFADYLYNHYLHYLPKDMLADKKLVIKHVQDFYKARGTEKSYRFLMNILYDKPIDFYYPKIDILRASDGKWFVENYLNIKDIKYANVANSDIVYLNNFLNRKIYGNTSNSQGTVYKVDRNIKDGVIYDDLYISDIKGSFLEGENLYARVLDEEDSNVYLLSATVQNNSVFEIIVTNEGSLYNVGDYLIFSAPQASNGVTANAQVELVSEGKFYGLLVNKYGAGFQVNNPLTFTAEYGSGASGIVSVVDDNNYYHPNSYNLISSTIALEANTPLSNSIFANLNLSIVSSPNINSTLISALNQFSISGLGPINTVTLTNAGSGYTVTPTIDVTANTIMRELGILGRMEIINPGSGYAINDTIEFINPSGFPGFGALANVKNVDGSGAITQVQFVKYNDEVIGGSGYIDSATLQPKYPTANVVSGTGNGAIVRVTALLGDGEEIYPGNIGMDIGGAIRKIKINNYGSGYTSPPTINLAASGDGTATAYAKILRGKGSLPGRFLNDDGFISSFNFLEDRDYYQAYSYVINVKESIATYRDILKNLVHSSGMIMFGEYDLEMESQIARPNISVLDMQYVRGNIASFSYLENQTNTTITLINHGYSNNDNVFIDFTSDSELTNKYYQIILVTGANTFLIANTSAYDANGSGQAIVYV